MLARPPWAHVQHLQITFWDSKGEGAHLRSSAMSSLCRAQWLMLTSLGLRENWLRYRSISCLVSAHWPALLFLNLSRTRLSISAGVRFSDGEWPLLASLDLSCVHFGESFFSKATDGDHLACLEHAILNNTRLTLTATSMGMCHLCNAATHFQQVKWRLLEKFRAHDNVLECDDIQSLVQCFNWPCLKTLELSECNLGSEAVGCIAMGKWPLLEYLGLDRCDDIQVQDMQRLTSAEWPLLKHLRIGVLGPEAVDESVRLLAGGPWSLHSLSLSVWELTIMSLRFLLRDCQV